jgi:DNA-binding NtrC family response regulator
MADKAKKVAIAERCDLVSKSLSGLFSHLGAQPIVATNADDFFSSIKEAHLLLISPQPFRGKSTDEVIEKALEINPTIVVVFCSAFGDLRNYYADLGFHSINKPCSMEEVRSVLSLISVSA